MKKIVLLLIISLCLTSCSKEQRSALRESHSIEFSIPDDLPKNDCYIQEHPNGTKTYTILFHCEAIEAELSDPNKLFQVFGTYPSYFQILMYENEKVDVKVTIMERYWYYNHF